MTEPTYSGRLGFAIIPGASIRHKAAEIASRWHDDAEHVVDTRSVHITLYHTQLLDVPECVIESGLRALHRMLGASQFTLSTLLAFNPHIFWIFEPALPAQHKKYLEAQKIAVGCLLPYLDRKNLVMPHDDEKSSINIPQARYRDEYGYALLFDQAMPHITLCSKVGGFHTPPFVSCEYSMSVERIVFARFGKFGKMEHVIHSSVFV